MKIELREMKGCLSLKIRQKKIIGIVVSNNNLKTNLLTKNVAVVTITCYYKVST